MPTPEQSLQNLNQFLDNSIDSFSKDIPGIQDEVFRKVQGLLKDLDLSRGDVKATAKNLRKINRIKREIEQIILSEKYIDEVTKFNQAFEKGTDLQTSYFNSIQKGFSTPDFISTLRDASMANTKAALTESGIQSNIVDKAGDIIQRNISESANFSDLVEDMRTFLTKTEQGVGALSRHTSQIVTDSLNTYAAEYNRFVSDNLDMKWFVYSGAIVEGSRSFCRSLIKKKYVHKSEFGKVSRGSFVPKPIDLKGLKPNTNAKTLQINRGGWHCNHLLSPIAEEFVPKNIRAKFASKSEPKPETPPVEAPPIVKPKIVKPPKASKGFKPAKSIEEAEAYAKKFADDVDYKGLNVTHANEINKSLDSIYTKYPKLNKLNIIRTTKEGRSWASASGTELNINTESYFNNSAMEKAFKLSVTDYKKTYTGKFNSWKATIDNNPEFYSDKVSRKRLRSLRESAKYDRHNVVNSGTKVKSVIDHEFGHVIDGQVGRQYGSKNLVLNDSIISNELQSLKHTAYNRAVRNGDIYKISAYSRTKASEFFAESFAIYRHDKSLLPNYISDMIEDYLQYVQ